MEMLPRALEKALGALLCDHSVTSWKITAEGLYPTIVLRLRPCGDSQENGYCVQRKTFRAKPPSQVERDRRRLVEYKQRSDSKKDQFIPCVPQHNFSNKHAGENDTFGSVISDQNNIATINIVDKSSVSVVEAMPSDSGSVSERTGNVGRTINDCGDNGGSLDTGHARGADCDQGREFGPSVEKDETINCNNEQEFPSLFPDIFPNKQTRGTESRESCNLSTSPQLSPSPPLSPLRLTAARGAREPPADEMDTAPDRDICSETHEDSEWSTDSEEESVFLETVRQKCISSKASPFAKDFMKDENRNTKINTVVLDRRGSGTPRLVCCSEDVVLTYDTGSKHKDFLLRDWSTKYRTIADDLVRCGREWPQINRNGVYRHIIEELTDDFTRAVDIVRKIL